MALGHEIRHFRRFLLLFPLQAFRLMASLPQHARLMARDHYFEFARGRHDCLLLSAARWYGKDGALGDFTPSQNRIAIQREHREYIGSMGVTGRQPLISAW